MNSDIQTHEMVRKYLLGTSASEDAALVEERLLTDDEFYEELLIIEDELLDQYVADLLPDSEKEPFETYFLASSERREKLRFTRNLKKYVSRAEADRASVADYANDLLGKDRSGTKRTQNRFSFWSHPILSYSLAAAAVITVVLVGVMIYQVWNVPPHPGKTLAVELVPGLSRGDEGMKQITVTADITTVQFQLRSSNISGFRSYRAILQKADGIEISRQDDLRNDPASNDQIICPIPAGLLKPGIYSLKLSGLNQQNEYDDIGRYYVRVTQ